MNRRVRIAGIAAGSLLGLLLIGPFLIPVPPLEGTVPPQELADPDSQFIVVDGLQVHYKIAGRGEPTLILLHGFAASTFSWQEVMEPLAESATVVAFDRTAFGLTERPLPGEWRGENPYSRQYQADLTVGLMDALGVEQAVLVGHSAGGTVSALTALRHPQRVRALVLVDAAIYAGGGSRSWILPLLRTPQMRHLGPLIARDIREWGKDFARSAWHDPSRITPQIWADYTKPLQAENWDRALWELTAAGDSLNLSAHLDQITMPVLVITGDDDRIVPTEQSIRLAEELPTAKLVVIPECGHLPHEECPEPFQEAVARFVEGLRGTQGPDEVNQQRGDQTDMTRLKPEKLHVEFSAGTTPEGPVTPRCYTLTHSDMTGDLFLTVGPDYDRAQISGWQTRLMRDEVLGEWIDGESGPALHLHCHVSGGLIVGSAGWRDAIFRRELPLVLEALRFGDRHLFDAHPELDQAPIQIHFHARQARYNRTETWGMPADYDLGFGGD